jgi:hypothetical protein
MNDETEPIRRARVAQLAAETTDNRAELEARHGQVWTTEELRKEFVVVGFAAPLVIARRLSDNHLGSLEFQHWPRYYFGWQEDA